jgi:hypothetical protein
MITFEPYVKRNGYDKTQINTGKFVKLKDGTVFLIGDVNEILGVCDDCKEFDEDEIAEVSVENVLDLLNLREFKTGVIE